MSERPQAEPGYFPIFLRLDGERVVLMGGGDEAVAKARLLLGARPELHVFAEHAGEDMETLAAERGFELHHRAATADDLAGARFCVVALDTIAEARAAVTLARAAGILVNAVDKPAISDCIVPALVDRGPVQVAIGTGGAAPALARDLRARVEAAVPPGYAALARLCRAWRQRVAGAVPGRAERRRFWDAVMDGPEAEAALAGDMAEADRLIAARLAGKTEITGRASLVGAGPGDPELMTLRAVRVLKRADVVLYDALVDPAILDLARRDARRIDVGKRCGRHAMSQAAINALILEHAQAGAHVVRLKGGDPFIFGRGGEEMETLRAAGVPVEVVPGITAACAAAARLGIPLTHRDVARSLHLVTGHGSNGQVPDLDWRTLASGDGTVAAYMASRTLRPVAARLMAAGLAPSTPAVAVENASRANERRLFGTLGTLATALEAAGMTGPTLVLIGRVVALHAEAELQAAA